MVKGIVFAINRTGVTSCFYCEIAKPFYLPGMNLYHLYLSMCIYTYDYVENLKSLLILFCLFAIDYAIIMELSFYYSILPTFHRVLHITNTQYFLNE